MNMQVPRMEISQGLSNFQVTPRGVTEKAFNFHRNNLGQHRRMVEGERDSSDLYLCFDCEVSHKRKWQGCFWLPLLMLQPPEKRVFRKGPDDRKSIWTKWHSMIKNHPHQTAHLKWVSWDHLRINHGKKHFLKMGFKNLRLTKLKSCDAYVSRLIWLSLSPLKTSIIFGKRILCTPRLHLSIECSHRNQPCKCWTFCSSLQCHSVCLSLGFFSFSSLVPIILVFSLPSVSYLYHTTPCRSGRWTRTTYGKMFFLFFYHVEFIP